MTKDYTWLVGSIANWLHRTDLASVIPDFIVLAETKMGEDLDAQAMELTVPLTTVPNVATVDLPADCKDLRSIRLLPAGSSPIDYVTPTAMNERERAQPGLPRLYTIIGNQLRFSPVSDTAVTVEIVYERFIPSLTASTPTNWLIARSPNAYLFGSLAFAQPYIQKDERTTFQNLYADAIAGINTSDWGNAADMHIKSDARTP